MKTLHPFLFFLLFSLLAGAPLMAQKSSGSTKFVQLKSFTFTPKAFQNYKRAKLKPAAFKVNSKGQARPARGYKMAVTGDKKYLVIVRTSDPFIPASRIDMRPGEDGAYWCVCSGYPDDCMWEDSNCKGSCKCGIGFEPDEVGGIADYETPGGGYY